MCNRSLTTYMIYPSSHLCSLPSRPKVQHQLSPVIPVAPDIASSWPPASPCIVYVLTVLDAKIESALNHFLGFESPAERIGWARPLLWSTPDQYRLMLYALPEHWCSTSTDMICKAGLKSMEILENSDQLD